jgi:hypothetical protein
MQKFYHKNNHRMFEFLQENVYKLIFSSSAAIVIGIIAQKISNKKNNNSKNDERAKQPIVISDSTLGKTENIVSPIFNIGTTSSFIKIPPPVESDFGNESLERRKALTKIVFIDDDTKFRVVKMFKASGWLNTKAIKDLKNIDDILIRDADILFVDIQGVGKALNCKEEGLGLALSLKQKYSQKKVVIYSAENTGDRFHEALRKADYFLAKNAEPLEFLSLVEQFSKEIYPND